MATLEQKLALWMYPSFVEQTGLPGGIRRWMLIWTSSSMQRTDQETLETEGNHVPNECGGCRASVIAKVLTFLPCEGGALTRMTAFYPAKMCLQVAKMVEEVHYYRVARAYAADPCIVGRPTSASLFC